MQGASVGLTLGEADGEGVGAGVGLGVGAGVGSGVGEGVGRGLGCDVGAGEGRGVGLGVGAGVGTGVGRGVGSGVGKKVGDIVGERVGGLKMHSFPSRTKNGPIWSPATSGTEHEVWMKQEMPSPTKTKSLSALKGPSMVKIAPSSSSKASAKPFLFSVSTVGFAGYVPARHVALLSSW